MTFPGAGRAVWIGGSSSGGTGRTNDWSTYDGTEDSAWQQWVDDTSTAISSSISVTATPMNAHGFGGGRGALVLTDGSVNKVGLFIADTDDATAGQFKLYGSHANTGTMRGYGPMVLLTGTDDDGSLVTYSWSGDSLSGGSKISGLYKFYSQDSTWTPPHQGVAITLSERFPYTGDYNTYQGANYNNGSSNWPASAKTNYLQVWAINPDNRGQTTKTNQQWFTPYRIANTQDLIDSPSSALLERDGNVIGDTSPNYIENNNKMDTHFEGGGTVTWQTQYGGDGNVYLVQNKDNFLIPFTRTVGDPQFTTDPAGIHTVAFSYASINAGYSDSEDFHPTARTFKFNWTHHRFAHLEDVTSTAEFYRIGGENSDNNYGQYRTGYNTGRDAAEAKIRAKMKAIQIGDHFIGLYGDCASVTDIGNLYLTACSGNPDQNTNNNFNNKTLIYADSDSTGSAQAFGSATGAQTTPASNNIQVSTVNGSDSSSTAYDPANTALFALEGDYFAVAWTTSTNVYASIFKIVPQSSAAPTISRIADTINLGTIPAGSGTKTLSGMRINKGVGVITCGNYYRIIKTDTI
jgi:hypothetical protein